MANVTIYVREDDMDIYQKAKEMTAEGSLSGVIAKALREYLDKREQAGAGMRDLEIRVGTPGAWRRIRFFGRLIARNNPPDIDEGWLGDIPGEEWTAGQRAWARRQGKVFSLYQGRRGKLLMHWCDAFGLFCEYQVFEGFQGFCEKSGLPRGAPAIEAIARSLGEDAIEYLDI